MKKVISILHTFIFLLAVPVVSAEINTPVNEDVKVKRAMTLDKKVDDIFGNKVEGFIEQSVELDSIRKKIILTNEKIKLLRVEQQLEKMQKEVRTENKVKSKPKPVRRVRPVVRSRPAKPAVSQSRNAVVDARNAINNGQFEVLSVSNFNGKLLIVLNWNGADYKLKKGSNRVNSFDLFVGEENITVSNSSTSRIINYKII